MLLGQLRLLRRIFCDGKVNEEHGVVRRKGSRAVKILQRSFVVAFRHQGRAVVHQAPCVSRSFDGDVLPE